MCQLDSRHELGSCQWRPFQKVHLLARPDRGDPAVDLTEFSESVFRTFLSHKLRGGWGVLMEYALDCGRRDAMASGDLTQALPALAVM